MKYQLPLFFLVVLMTALNFDGLAQSSKSREKEKKQYWQKHMKIAKSTNHDAVAGKYPETGWLSGVWCKEGEKDGYIILQNEGWELGFAVTTRGYTATAHKVIFKPEAFLFSEAKFMDKPVYITNESHYDLWYFPKGTGATSTRYFYVERIRKISDTSFEVLYRGNYTMKDPSVDFEAFYKNESPKIHSLMHWKTPKVYVKCK